jgi:ATP-dependent Clp protease ATP-binding subunit ClpA
MIDFRSFGEGAIKVVMLAQEESRRLGHNFVGREQLLTGLLSTDNGAARLLKAADVTLDAARAEVEKIIGRGSGFISIEIPFTPGAKRALEQASEIAYEQRRKVEPEHILLAIVNSQPGVALRILENLGVSVEQLKEAIEQSISDLPQQPLQSDAELESQTRITPSIPFINRTAPTMMTVTVLPQENGRWVAKVYAGAISADHPGFTSLAYGDTDFLAIAEALEGLARIYRDFKGGSRR